MDAPQRESLLFSPTMVHQTLSSVRTLSNPTISASAPKATTTVAAAATKPGATAMEGGKKPLDIISLMSPPELPPFETFSHSALSTTPNMMRRSSLERRTGPNPPLSPPISPFAKSTNCIDPVPTLREESRDPILYPTATDISPTPSQQPLFKAPSEQEEERANTAPTAVVATPTDLETKRRVDQHLASRPSYLFERTTPPEREEYELALYFKSTVMQSYTQNPSAWLRKERAILMADKRANMRAAEARAKFQPILPAKIRRPSASRVSKPKPILPTYKPLAATATAGTGAPSSAVARTAPRPASGPLSAKMASTELPPRQRRESATVGSSRRKASSSTPEPRGGKSGSGAGAGGSATKPVGPNREDKDFEALPDYSPPLSSLPENRPNCLKVDWKGNALDLTNDPYVSRLHPDERLLAAGLRLDCATYLTSKRRIFIRRLECARIGKEFRKTDAQQACKIDVNKASKLWTAYERVHWLDISWMQKYL